MITDVRQRRQIPSSSDYPVRVTDGGEN